MPRRAAMPDQFCRGQDQRENQDQNANCRFILLKQPADDPDQGHIILEHEQFRDMQDGQRHSSTP